MNQKIFTIILGVFYTLYVNAQTIPTDASGDIEYQQVCREYELRSPNTLQLLEKYQQNHPDSRFSDRIIALKANIYFEQERFLEAIALYKSAKLDALSNEERDLAIYNLATSYLKFGNLEEAAIWFRVLQGVSTKHNNDATFQLAYISYTNKEFDNALQQFKVLENDKVYATLVVYYIAEIYNRTGRFAQAEGIAKEFLSSYPNHKDVAEMQRVLGESCYRQRKYSESIEPLTVYCSSVQYPLRSATYMLGMSYLNCNQYETAAEYLGRSTIGNDELAQNAYLHMGLAYLNVSKQNQARMAFEQASRTNFNPQIREQALFNYAVCLHETSYSPFAESVIVFEQLLNEYPNSAYTEKVNDYLIDVYMNTRSYDVALQSINKIKNPGARIMEAKEKILFQLGTQEFANAQFNRAIGYFNQAIAIGQYNVGIKADCYYWRAESYYRQEKYRSAETDYRNYLTQTPNVGSETHTLALYNLGYSLFQQGKYSEACILFQKYTTQGTNNDRIVQADAFNRLGDCYFYNRSFDMARANYRRAGETDASLGDYALYQEALIHGLQHNYTEKIQVLNYLITDYPNSQYLDDALYEQGRSFVQLEDNTNAINRYKLLVDKYPDSAIARKAANEIGLLYYQNDMYTEAIRAYKSVVLKYAGSEEAKLAQRDLKSIYIDLNKIDEYAAFAATIPGAANFDVTERDSLTFVAAERTYMRGEIAAAQNSFIAYLQNFPNGAFALNAHYYLGTIAYNNAEFERAEQQFDYIVAYPANKYSEDAMAKVATMAFNRKDYVKAFRVYSALANHTTSEELKVTANLGAAFSAFLCQNFEEAIRKATIILADPKVSPELLNQAYYYRAKSYLAIGQEKYAINDLKALSSDTRNIYGAEAKYLLAQLYYKTNQMQQAEQEILDFIESSTPHMYWLARGFILLSDIYYYNGRVIDARQYLLSLQQNYNADDDIKNMIQERLAKMN